MPSGWLVFPGLCVLAALLELAFWSVYLEFPTVFLRSMAALHFITNAIIFGMYIVFGVEITKTAWIFTIVILHLVDIVPMCMLIL